MGTTISFTFDGDTQIDRHLERIELGAANIAPAFQTLGDLFAAAEKRQFKSEGAYGSGGWVALSPAYEAWKSRHFPGKPILQRSGDLMESLTQRPFGIEVIEPQFAIFGSGVEYGIYHQQGAGNNPVRKPIDLPESVRRAWIKVLQNFLMTGESGRTGASSMKPFNVSKL